LFEVVISDSFFVIFDCKTSKAMFKTSFSMTSHHFRRFCHHFRIKSLARGNAGEE